MPISKEAMNTDHLVLAGGGHAHALLLHRWANYPHLKPKGLITLINRSSSTLYSGMLPGLISGYYDVDELSINLRQLSDKAGVSFIVAEIEGIDTSLKCLLIKNRPPIYYQIISFDIGSETHKINEFSELENPDLVIPIKPLETALGLIKKQDKFAFNANAATITIVGSGLAAIEVALALRNRWPCRPLRVKAYKGYINKTFKRALLEANINLSIDRADLRGPVVLCTGSYSPKWLEDSGLPVNNTGRVITRNTLQVLQHPELFAVGDCGVIENECRPASGVWAVRGSVPLGRNLKRLSQGLKPLPWKPQGKALQLIGAKLQSSRPIAWAVFGNTIIGPHFLLWAWKEFLDRRFMGKFNSFLKMNRSEEIIREKRTCRGCGAKIPARSLLLGLNQAGLSVLGTQPEDAAYIDCSLTKNRLLQSVDGFPALLSDPWLNGRITALHACSDLWACGVSVTSAQVVITLPLVSRKLQQELLAQSLAGIKSALEPQGAKLIGGHTLEDRSEPPQPISLGIQIALTVNGCLKEGEFFWPKDDLQLGDVILLSKAIGTGVLFAAAMDGKSKLHDMDSVTKELVKSQFCVFQSLLSIQKKYLGKKIIHACTDITGFGLLGHLGEMLESSNKKRIKAGLCLIRLKIKAENIQSFDGALDLINEGFSSSLSPENRMAWKLLEPLENGLQPIELKFPNDSPNIKIKNYKNLLELIVDPQTCGPLAISCSPFIAHDLVKSGIWYEIGSVVPS